MIQLNLFDWKPSGSRKIILPNGSIQWINSKGQFHRIDGPAIERANGSKSWWLNGELHRTDGPAIERTDGYKAWWLNGEKLTEEEFNKLNK